ncbi:hypothetical protein [Paenibacillus sp. MMS18-CY102]|uniref:hypothetical protein n=1 Tax=Paenibacillus sp. MMS18-CY102 TaxID=2682849 RepID=UPI001365F438|nr:hypothetical protein [Paenibacillus sp. MMS18-CY102]MWC27119.1 hypothetical protein [Paenibacillus sp. MMS18-CY102]
MTNLVASMPQQTAKYTIRPDLFRIDIYISRDQTIVIRAKKDPNYTEWLSVGKLNVADAAAGACIRYLLNNTPLPTTASLYWQPFEDATQMKYDELFVFYQHVAITRESDSHFTMNGEHIEREASDDAIQQHLLQLYEDYRKGCGATDEPGPIIDRMQQAITEIKAMEDECHLPEYLGPVSEHARTAFVACKHEYAFSPHEEVKSLLYELFKLQSSIYNRYMTAVR